MVTDDYDVLKDKIIAAMNRYLFLFLIPKQVLKMSSTTNFKLFVIYKHLFLYFLYFFK